MDTSNQIHTEGNVLHDHAYDTIEYCSQTKEDNGISPNCAGQSGERKGWFQGFKFPGQAEYKLPEIFFYIFLERNIYLLNYRTEISENKSQSLREMYNRVEVTRGWEWSGKNGTYWSKGKRVNISNYKVNKFLGSNIQHGDYS